MAAMTVPASAVQPFHKGRTPRPTKQHVMQRLPQHAIVVNEDFSKFSEGTEAAPAAEITYDVPGYAIPAKYTAMPGWTGQGIRPAGGAVAVYPYVDKYGETRKGYISTPPMMLGGTATITFRAKRLDSTETNLWVALCDEYNGPTYGVDEGDFVLTDEWKEYTVVAKEGSLSDNSYFQFSAQSGTPLIDDVKIDFIADRILAPEIESAANTAPGCFSVEWSHPTAQKYFYTLQCLSQPAQVNRGVLKCDFDGINVLADGKKIDTAAPNYPEGWTIKLSAGSEQDVCREAGMFASAPQSIVFDALTDTIESPVTPESIDKISMWVKLSQDQDDEYYNSLLGVDIFHQDTQEWETIANLNYWYIQNYAVDDVYTFDGSSIGSEDVTRVRFYLVQKGLINFYVDNIELSYKTRRDISYVAKDKETTETKAEFSGLDMNNDYYFWVKAYQDDITSEATYPVWVDGITGIKPSTPVISNVNSSSFQASWEPVGKADNYSVEVSKIVEAKADMPQVVVLEEDFNGITEGTVEAPGSDWASPMDFSAKGWTNTAWCATQPAWANGMIGSQGTSYFGQAGLVYTPRLNLSANGGNFDVEFTAYTTIDKYDFGADYGVVNEGICVYLLKQYYDNQALAGYMLDTPTVGTNSLKLHFENTGNIDFSDVILAFMTKTGAAFFIDQAKITQDLKTGETLKAPYSVLSTKETSAVFTGLDNKSDYGVTVTGKLYKDYVNYISDVSDMAIAKVSTASGVEDIAAEGAVKVAAGNGEIDIVCPDNVAANVYTAAGLPVANVKGTAKVSVSAGIYIVSAAGKAFKVLVR